MRETVTLTLTYDVFGETVIQDAVVPEVPRRPRDLLPVFIDMAELIIARSEESVRNAIVAIAEELRVSPGVHKAAIASVLPFGNRDMVAFVTTAGATGKHGHPLMGRLID